MNGSAKGEYMFTQGELDEAYSIVAKMTHRPFAPKRGAVVYPLGDEDDRRTYAACLELEQQGRIRRVDSWVLFEACEGEDGRTSEAHQSQLTN